MAIENKTSMANRSKYDSFSFFWGAYGCCKIPSLIPIWYLPSFPFRIQHLQKTFRAGQFGNHSCPQAVYWNIKIPGSCPSWRSLLCLVLCWCAWCYVLNLQVYPNPNLGIPFLLFLIAAFLSGLLWVYFLPLFRELNKIQDFFFFFKFSKVLFQRRITAFSNLFTRCGSRQSFYLFACLVSARQTVLVLGLP